MLDSPEKSSLATMLELTGENRDRLHRYIRPVEGRLPEGPDELVITDFIQKGLFKVGDSLYASTYTPDGVLNAIRYRVVGVSKSTAFKAIGYGFLVSEESMSALLNSDEHANLVYLFLEKGSRTEKNTDDLHRQVAAILEKSGIEVNDSWTIFERERQLSVFSLVFAAMKPLWLIVIFPLIGAVIAAMVWIYSFKRRREIWTYVSLGMRDRHVFMILAMEYWIIASLGMVAGLSVGAFSSYLAESANVWLQFSYTFSSPLGTMVGPVDLVIIAAFTLVSVLLWMWVPVRKIIRTVPFSY
jgi:ABC-type lipoprotein release transport system permease subunit